MVALLAVMATVRALYYTVGELGYRGEALGSYLQFADPLLLRHELVETVLHLHGQPPLFNLYLGLGLKLFGPTTRSRSTWSAWQPASFSCSRSSCSS